jgi:predicted nucleic acid-binding protein
MSSAILTPPPTATARLVVDTDVASFIFKWHPDFAPRYVNIVRGFELIVSFMTLAEMRQGALEANWGQRKCEVLEAYLADFSVLHSDSLLCSTWATIRNESTRKGRQMGSAGAWIAGYGAGSVGTAGDEQSEGLPPPGQAPACFHSGRITRQIETPGPPTDYSPKKSATQLRPFTSKSSRRVTAIRD